MLISLVHSSLEVKNMEKEEERKMGRETKEVECRYCSNRVKVTFPRNTKIARCPRCGGLVFRN